MGVEEREEREGELEIPVAGEVSIFCWRSPIRSSRSLSCFFFKKFPKKEVGRLVLPLGRAREDFFFCCFFFLEGK